MYVKAGGQGNDAQMTLNVAHGVMQIAVDMQARIVEFHMENQGNVVRAAIPQEWDEVVVRVIVPYYEIYSATVL